MDTSSQKFIVYRNNVIVLETDKYPSLPANSPYKIAVDTPEIRAEIAAWSAPLTGRQIANAEFMKLPDAVRGQFAIAWVAINARLDAKDKSAALAFFDTLIIPSEFVEQAEIIRTAISNS
jgi:hypothetical protein